MENYVLDFAVRTSGCRIKKSAFEPLFKKTLSLLKKIPDLKKISGGVESGGKIQGGLFGGGDIHFVIVDDEEISFINSTYRGKNSPTDVISLSYMDEDSYPQNNLIGEIFISLETAARQAKENRKTLKEELQELFTHGLLHIFGYDHKTAAEEKVMLALQKKILRKRPARRKRSEFLR